MFFYPCDCDLDPMTFIYDLDTYCVLYAEMQPKRDLLQNATEKQLNCL